MDMCLQSFLTNVLENVQDAAARAVSPSLCTSIHNVGASRNTRGHPPRHQLGHHTGTQWQDSPARLPSYDQKSGQRPMRLRLRTSNGATHLPGMLELERVTTPDVGYA